MKIQINKSEITKTNIQDLIEYTTLENQILALKKVARAYKFYAYISNLFNNTTILDIGSFEGVSALCFSKNNSNTVISYDLVERGQSKIIKDNIEFKLMDFRYDESLNYDNISMILIDIDPHDGLEERKMYSFLEEKKWKGLLILDDISERGLSSSGLNPSAFIWYPEMLKWWQEIKEEKYNLTDVGHFSGTGLVNFGKKYQLEIL